MVSWSCFEASKHKQRCQLAGTWPRRHKSFETFPRRGTRTRTDSYPRLVLILSCICVVRLRTLLLQQLCLPPARLLLCCRGPCLTVSWLVRALSGSTSATCSRVPTCCGPRLVWNESPLTKASVCLVLCHPLPRVLAIPNLILPLERMVSLMAPRQAVNLVIEPHLSFSLVWGSSVGFVVP